MFVNKKRKSLPNISERALKINRRAAYLRPLEPKIKKKRKSFPNLSERAVKINRRAAYLRPLGPKHLQAFTP
jgi:hypothetical protein